LRSRGTLILLLSQDQGPRQQNSPAQLRRARWRPVKTSDLPPLGIILEMDEMSKQELIDIQTTMEAAATALRAIEPGARAGWIIYLMEALDGGTINDTIIPVFLALSKRITDRTWRVGSKFDVPLLLQKCKKER